MHNTLKLLDILNQGVNLRRLDPPLPVQGEGYMKNISGINNHFTFSIVHEKDDATVGPLPETSAASRLKGMTE